MQNILAQIERLGYKSIEDSRVVVDSSDEIYYVVSGCERLIEVKANTKAQIILLHTDSDRVNFQVNDGAAINVVQLFAESSSSSVMVDMQGSSQCKIVSIQTLKSSASINIKLNARGAEAQVNTLQLTSGDDICGLDLKMDHQSADCTSRSVSKCVASGDSKITFDGLVYVAQDAQRTNGDQICHSMELSDGARIVAQPQLEIYADDVKCTHGATVGQIDTDAILYMRQRGLSESQARKLQMEGFAADIVSRCDIPEVCELITELVDNKLHTL